MDRRRTIAAALATLALAVAAVPSAAAECALEDGPRHVVARVLDPDTLQLDDRSELRLVGTLGPHALDVGSEPSAWPPEQNARKALEALVLGKSIELAFDSQRIDRYGRTLAHAFVQAAGERVWVQGVLLEAGHARAYVLPGFGDCLDALLSREAPARQRQQGLWASAAYAVREAADTAALSRLRGTYQVVEGNVHRVATVRGRTYLNFGADWRHDFTVAMARASGRDAREDGRAKRRLEGRRVRVRGWIEWRNGPFIDLDHPRAVELAEPGEGSTPEDAAEDATSVRR